MKICLVTMEWPPHGGGIGTYMFNLARGLVRLGHNVTVITAAQNPLIISGLDIVQVPLCQSSLFVSRKIYSIFGKALHLWPLRAFQAFRLLCDGVKFDIIETAEYGAWGRYFVECSDMPVVVKCHTPTHMIWASNPMSNSKNILKMPRWVGIQDKYERRQTFSADGIVSPSYVLATYLSSRWVIHRSRFTVLPNPIDADLFCPSQIDNEDKEEILYVGRLQHFKGVLDLAEAVKAIFEKYPKVTVRFIGMDIKAPDEFRKYGPMTSDVILSLIPREYHNRLKLTGYVSVAEMISHRRKAICTVVPGRGFESFSYTALEAMACGCPVVATHCGGPTEIIEDGVDGLLVSPGKPEELGIAIEKLLLDGELRKRIALNARAKVLKKYSIDVVVPQIVQYYERVISDFNKLLRFTTRSIAAEE
jgi:glycosyltransferase involved in cell wall biosynthesis